MSPVTEAQSAAFQQAARVSQDDLAARAGVLQLEKEKITSHLVWYIQTYNDVIAQLGAANTEIASLKTQIATLQASTANANKTLDGTASPVSETAAA
jgi:peptidoglycan hydrolase-like protein with peptidoglycan-binding domain